MSTQFTVDTLFVNGNIRTMDEARPTARSLAVFGGRVVALDDDADGLAARETIDLSGQTLLPGFNDAHNHVVQLGDRLLMLDIAPRTVSTIDDLLGVLANAASTTGAGSWIRGAGFDQHVYGRFPRLEEIDRATGDAPTWLIHCSGHMGLANSAALRAAGLDPRNPPTGVIDGGRFERDEETGAFTGLVTEGAQRMIDGMLRPPAYDYWLDCIEAGNAFSLSAGITSATDAGLVGPAQSGARPDEVGVYFEARQRGLINLRMTLMPEAAASESFAGPNGIGAGVKTGFGDSFMKIGAIKFFIDGSLLGQTAAVSQPFLTNHSRGDFMEDPAILKEKLIYAHASGWQVGCHAIGDEGVELVISAYEEAQRRFPRANARHRIEHAGITSVEQVDRILAVGAIPVPQSHFIGEFGDLMREALGDERVPMCYRQKSFIDRGIPVPGSSDSPVAQSSPLLGIHDLVNRTTDSGYVFGPDERLTPEQAVRCYTVNSAYSSFEENVKGKLAPGYFADMVLLDADPLTIDPAGIRDIAVLRTVIDGKTLFTQG